MPSRNSSEDASIGCKAIGGHPADLRALRKIADQHDLLLIGDASHSLGARYEGDSVGAIADLTTFSLHPVKLMTTGEGGVVTTESEKLAKKLRRIRNHGIDTDFRERAAVDLVGSPPGRRHLEPEIPLVSP